MRQVVGGNGSDTTAAVQSLLTGNNALVLANLYLIGEADSGYLLTDWESQLYWGVYGEFLSTVIKRGSVTTEVGLGTQHITVTWSPINQVVTSSYATANPYQLARLNQFANQRVRIWRVYMPTPGDANTLGAMEWFGGYIGQVTVGRDSIEFEVNSYMFVLDQKVPTQLIEVTNTLASYSGGQPPSGFSVMPQFTTFTGSQPNLLYADQTSPTSGGIPGTHSLIGNYVVFNGGTGATLQGAYSIIGDNYNYMDGNGNHHTALQLYSPLDWAPTPGVDTFYITAPPAIASATEGSFPYVPSPQTAV